MPTGNEPVGDTEFAACAKLTEQSDYRGLCAGLLQGFAALAPAMHAALLEVYDDRGQTPWQQVELEHLLVRHVPTLANQPQPAWLAEGVAASPAHGEVSVLERDDCVVFCLGGLNGLWRFIEIRHCPSPAIHASVHRLTLIFANLMRLFDRFERDPLTGLFNRQSFENRFADLLEYQQQNPSRDHRSDGMWLAIADIDHFKRVNDTYGHLFGDEILLLVSQIMRQSFRFEDLLFRYGGEEFIIILNKTDEAGARLALERFHAAVRAYEFPRLRQLTISIGWATVLSREFSSDVIHKADKALYYAKDNGRDRVVSFEELADDPAGR